MWFFLILGIMMVFNAYWLASVALSPVWVTRCQSQYERPLRTTLAGLLCTVPLVVVAIVCFKQKHPVGNLIGLLSLGTPIVLGMAGSAGFAQRLGLGLAATADAQQPWRRVLRGGVVFTFMMLLPLIGWVVVLPWALVSGLGAMVLSRGAARQERSDSSSATRPDAAVGSTGSLAG